MAREPQALQHTAPRRHTDPDASFSGYAATMAYLPSRKLAIAISVTVDESADPDHNYSTDIFKDLAAEFVPEVPLQ